MSSEAPGTLVLHFVHGKYSGRVFPIERGKNVIVGRSPEADLVLADDTVSRKHARVYTDHNRIWVRDLGSRTGTVVNGERIERRFLRDGDRIAIGSSLARVESAASTSLPRAGEVGRKRAHEGSGHSMTGSIEEIPLTDVLQWLSTSRRSGSLTVRDSQQGRAGALHLRDGRVYFAEILGIQGLHPQKALLRMFQWDRGLFELEHGADVQPPTEIDLSLEHMLMEAARQQDELAALAKTNHLPSHEAVVSLVNPPAARWRDLPAEELDLLQDMLTAGGWWEFANRSEVDDVTLTKLLVQLQRKGIVRY